MVKRYSQYNPTNTCDRIIKIGFSWRRCRNKLSPGKARKEYEKGKWVLGL